MATIPILNIPTERQPLIHAPSPLTDEAWARYWKAGPVADTDWYRFWKAAVDALRELQTAFPITSGAVNVGFNPPPRLTFGGNAAGMAYADQVGRCYVLGPLVLFWIALTLTAKGGSVGAATIGPLPFAASAEMPFGYVPRMNFMTAGVGDTELSAVLSGTTLSLQKMNAGTLAGMTNADFTNASLIRINGIYYTTP